ncbi:acyl-homoserine-lactone synthase [Fuscibacter oryzae]|jgi:acyl homoserine lactone synthase|uniref:GNAT family N-acetyltransferase n=1 Tax=Fuscibacter oryzae TaxID=2803939 RepID=A0A8J7MS45_9RHOB|nr:acyl-homoserine-lactone synthase [Fuscibacter oryzae]MBL4929517.1 GNAT family N-acetyltransferase [Fuscibacter oryzae]
MLEVSVTSIAEAPARWDLVRAFLVLRRRVFIDQMDWSLRSHEDIEFEQYDTLGHATYVIAHEGDRVVAGARLLRCDVSIGSGTVSYSYMIRDAVRGIIDLPQDLCWDEPPTDAESWELTRLVSDSASPVAARRVLDAANDYIRDRGGKQCLFLGGPGFMRMARSYGYAPRALGNVVSNRSGRFLAFACPTRETEWASTPQDAQHLTII